MIDMSSERWGRLRRLLARALELDGEARSLYVRTLRPEEVELRADLERLLVEHAGLGEEKFNAVLKPPRPQLACSHALSDAAARHRLERLLRPTRERND